MTHPERLRYASLDPDLSRPNLTNYDSLGPVTFGPNQNVLPVLDLGERDTEVPLSLLDVVHTPGGSFVRKWPEFGIPDEAVKLFNFISKRLVDYPLLHERFPRTTIMDKNKGRYYLQPKIETLPGRANMASREDPTIFDPKQVKDPVVLNDLVRLENEAVQFFIDTMKDPAGSGCRPGEGLLLESYKPGSFVCGRLPGDTEDKVYFIDFFPVLEITPEVLKNQLSKLNEGLDKTSRESSGMPTEEVLRRSGFDTSLPSLEDHNQSPRTVTKTRRIGAIALAT